MSKRFNNKRLFYLLAGLIVILFLTVLIKIPGENETLKSKLIAFDTLEISKIILYPRINNFIPVEFNRGVGKWTVQQGNIISATQKDAVQNIFSDVLGIKPKSLSTMDKSKWKEFELTDSLATRIKFLNKKGKVLADLMLGKFSYKQVNDQYGKYGANNVQGTSFVRLYNENEVYATDGFISFFFNKKFNDWRDKTLIQLNQNDVTNIRFTFPGDSSYILAKRDLKWYSGDQTADSARTANFLNTISYLNGQEIKDNFKPVQNPSYQLLIEGNNLLNISVKCFKDETTDKYIINSSINPDIWFISKTDGLFNRLFKPKGYFIKKEIK